MLLFSAPIPRASTRLTSISIFPHLYPTTKIRYSKLFCISFRIEDIAQMAHNKVLISAAVSAAFGQLSKPFTSAFFHGRNLDFMAAIRAGGFPSSHSSAVVAAATTLALERGFSDSIVGIAVVYACLVMYDAQGVRREVGKHANLLNKMSTRIQDCDYIDPNSRSSRKSSTSIELEVLKKSSYDDEKKSREFSFFTPLNRSIGHTEVEVIAGALLGFLVSLLTYNVN